MDNDMDRKTCTTEQIIGMLREEILSGEIFTTLREAQAVNVRFWH
jgi:hypothetical protein